MSSGGVPKCRHGIFVTVLPDSHLLLDGSPYSFDRLQLAVIRGRLKGCMTVLARTFIRHILCDAVLVLPSVLHKPLLGGAFTATARRRKGMLC